MHYDITTEDTATVLHLSERLVDSDRAAFETVLTRALSGKPREVVVDFAGLQYMDSAGLGLLLTLRERAQAQGTSVRLRNPEGAVRDMLQLSRFDTLFRIEAGAKAASR
ncbi:anti-sigma factor antagonist [Roseospira navarrensis]|uniref:anti-sigma factor antagonist n=1 Tax=Roseospira navarrensis TaxID=140058 RepID=UPI001478755C